MKIPSYLNVELTQEEWYHEKILKCLNEKEIGREIK